MDRSTIEPDVARLPGEQARKWIEFHSRYAAPGEHAHEIVWDFTRDAAGPFFTDPDGNVLLDFTSHIGAAPLGYNNPKIIAGLKEFDLLDPIKIAGQDFYLAGGGTPEAPACPGPMNLMKELGDIAPGALDTVFLSNSGAEAIENGMKIATASTTGAKHGITFHGAFHGRTHGALSVTRAGAVYSKGYLELPGIRDVPFCDYRGCEPSSCTCSFFDGATSQLRRMLDPETGWISPAEVGFVILEPVQGVGGYRFPSEAFMQEVSAVCEEFNIMLIADEIQSGLGRTGEWWATDHYPLTPDVIAGAKALRVGATVASREIFPAEKNRLGSTWGGGDILGSMVGSLTIDAIRDHALLGNATRQGRAIRERAEDASVDHVTDVRGKGLMLAVEMDTRQRRDTVIAEAVQRGLLLLGCGSKSIRVLPPLDVTDREIDLGTTRLLSAIRAA